MSIRYFFQKTLHFTNPKLLNDIVYVIYIYIIYNINNAKSLLTELKPHSEGGAILSPKDDRRVRVAHSTEETAAGGQVLFLHLPRPPLAFRCLPPPLLLFLPSTVSLSGDAMENTAIFLFRDAHVLNPPAALISDLLARVDSSAAL